MGNIRICHRCGFAIFGEHAAVEVTIDARPMTLCSSCGWLLFDWISMPHIAAQLEPHGADGPPVMIPASLA